MLFFLYLFVTLFVFITLIASQIAKTRHGSGSVKHLKWALANSASFLVLSSMMVFASSGLLFWLGVVLLFGFMIIGAFEGLMLWQEINRQKKSN